MSNQSDITLEQSSTTPTRLDRFLYAVRDYTFYKTEISNTKTIYWATVKNTKIGDVSVKLVKRAGKTQWNREMIAESTVKKYKRSPTTLMDKEQWEGKLVAFNYII